MTSKDPEALLSVDQMAGATDDLIFGDVGFDVIEVPIKRVTVLYGYGRMSPKKRHYLDAVEFTGGVAQDVPEEVAKAWQTSGNVRIKILPPESTEVDWAQAVGLKPMNPTKLAALLGASDMDQLVNALGPDRTRQLLEALNRRLSQTNGVRKGQSAPR